eukprot:3810691-Lingulodinium_polyedra.AAC.1
MVAAATAASGASTCVKKSELFTYATSQASTRRSAGPPASGLRVASQPNCRTRPSARGLST